MSASAYEKLRIIAAVVFVGFLAGLLYCFIHWEDGYPFNTFLFKPTDRFMDFFNTFRVAADPYREVSFGSGYFPMSYILLRIFNLLPEQAALYCLLGLFSATMLFSGKFFAKANNVKSYVCVCAVCLFSYAYLFLCDRGNTEMIMFMLLLAFYISFMKEKDGLAAFFLAMAACCKIYPAVLGVLFLKEKRWRGAILSVVFGVILMLASGIACGLLDPERMQVFFLSQEGFNENIALTGAMYQHGHSFFAMVRIIMEEYAIMIPALEDILINGVSQMLMVYMGFMVLSIVGITLWILKSSMPLWKIVFLAVTMMTFLPHVSFDYTLVHLMPPLFLFVAHEDETIAGKFDKLYAVLFALLLIPMNWMRINVFYFADIGLILRPLIVILFIIMFAYESRAANSAVKAQTA